MSTEKYNLNGPPHPLAGKLKLAGYSALAHRLGVPRSTAVRMVERGEIRTFSEKVGELVVDEAQVNDCALQTAIKAEIDFNKSQDRARIARTLADPDRATDNDLIYSLARTSGKESSELYWHFAKRKESGRPFIEEKYHKEVNALEEAKAQFPQKVEIWNAKEGRTETKLVPPLIQKKTPSE